ncbi:MAG: ABC transporter permease [Planctomycetota bacterium]|nr:MAG: ABC transporter permease [Planctomycetota bacterium]
MVLENEPIPFGDWIAPALLFFLQAAGILALLALVGGYLIAAFRYGPLDGGDRVFRFLKRGLGDLIALSPRRVMALAWLAVQESLRRRVLVGFGVFLLILLFAGWFLDTDSNDPATLYISFVLTATTYLVLLMALFLSVFSLPADIKNKTIHTVVTKPVRPGEIVLGRIIGFSLIGTMLLALMGVFSYFFVVRLLNHTHEVEVASLEPLPGGSSDQRAGRTEPEHSHRHEVTLEADGTGSTNTVNGHWHEIDPVEDGDETRYVLGPPRGMFNARVPEYGELRFRDRSGAAVSRGINVGNEWKYRSFIEGATLAAAVWRFDGITPERYGDSLPIEMTVRVFRSHKGDIEQPIRGTLKLRNPRNIGIESAVEVFQAKDGTVNPIEIPRKLTTPEGRTIDLFEDLAPEGELEIEMQCLDSGQYFGVAKADLYLRARDASFQVNFIKGFLGIWVRMLLVTSLGVMFSTFLSGPVAMLATLAALVLGTSTGFIFDVAAGTVEGGGPAESFIRLVQQKNVTVQLEPGLTTDVVKAADVVFMAVMTSVTSLLPDFGQFDSVEYVAHGYDIPPDLLLVQVLSGVGFVIAMFAIGYFFLRMREVAR